MHNTYLILFSPSRILKRDDKESLLLERRLLLLLIVSFVSVLLSLYLAKLGSLENDFYKRKFSFFEALQQNWRYLKARI